MARIAAGQIVYGNGLLLNGSTQYASRSVVTSNTDDITLTCWYNPTNFTGIASLMYNGNADSQQGYGLYVDTAGIFKLNQQFSSGLSSGITLSTGTWYMLSAVRNGGVWQLYVNGVAQGSTISGGNNPPDTYFTVGALQGATPTQFAAGKIDEVRFYTRPLSAAELLTIYTRATSTLTPDVSTTGLVGLWKLDETSGTTAADSSGNGRTLTLVGSPTFAQGYVEISNAPARSASTPRFLARNFSSCLNFVVDGDYVDLGDNFNVAFNSAISVSVWVNPTSLSGGRAIFGKEKAVSGFNGYTFTHNSDGTVEADFVTTLNTNDFLSKTTSAVPILKNVWCHLGLVYNNKTSKVYFNGTLYSTTITRNTVTSGAGQTGITCNIGNRNNSDGTNANWIGLIDDVRIFNGTELTQQQFKDIFYQGVNPNGVTLSGWYKLDEGSGSSAIDSSGNGPTGSIVGATYSTNVFTINRSATP